MNKVNSCSVFFIVCWLVVLACPALAHQQKESNTSILFNTRSGNIEVAHRFYIHDAESAVKRVVDKQADLMSDVKSQQAFARYIVDHFSMALGQDRPVNLQLVGQQVEGKFFWVYQEAPIPDSPKSIVIAHNALMDIWPAQRNVVSVEGLGPIKSIELTSSDYQKTLTF